MTAFEVPIYPEESPDIGTPVTSTPDETSKEFEQAMRGVRTHIGAPVMTYRCSLGSECTRTLTCKGLHTEVTICTGTETCKDASHE